MLLGGSVHSPRPQALALYQKLASILPVAYLVVKSADVAYHIAGFANKETLKWCSAATWISIDTARKGQRKPQHPKYFESNLHNGGMHFRNQDRRDLTFRIVDENSDTHSSLLSNMLAQHHGVG